MSLPCIVWLGTTEPLERYRLGCLNPRRCERCTKIEFHHRTPIEIRYAPVEEYEKDK